MCPLYSKHPANPETRRLALVLSVCPTLCSLDLHSDRPQLQLAQTPQDSCGLCPARLLRYNKLQLKLPVSTEHPDLTDARSQGAFFINQTARKIALRTFLKDVICGFCRVPRCSHIYRVVGVTRHPTNLSTTGRLRPRPIRPAA